MNKVTVFTKKSLNLSPEESKTTHNYERFAIEHCEFLR